MGLTKTLVTDALRTVIGPGEVDLVTARAVEWVAACDDYASVKLFTPALPDDPARKDLARRATQAVHEAAGRSGNTLASLTIEFVNKAGDVLLTCKYQGEQGQTAQEQAAPAPAAQAPSAPAGHRPIAGLQQQSPQDTAGALPGVTYIVAVGAGKGGVGKSTVALNLAVALARAGHAVGLLDGDIYGPSMPTMLDLGAHEQIVRNGKLQPFLVHGIKAITVGKLVDPEKPLIWRGPMAHGAFKQLTEQTDWGALDYLIIDLPPGTGDVPLTMAQMLQLTGAVVVCTPQKVAQDDAVRAARMFQQLGVEVLGVVENMSFFIGDDGKEYDIFGRGGAQHMAQRLALPYLGQIPITMALRANSDSGNPTANFDPKSAGEALPRALETLARNLEAQVNLAAMKMGRAKPTLTIR